MCTKLMKCCTCLALVLSLSSILCAPLSSDELCSVELDPQKIISKRFDKSTIAIKCSATIDSEQSTNATQFSNPVFDLSFGGAPRTGVYIIRGNVSCGENRTKCWSEYKLANSIGNLIQSSGNIEFSCQVADQLKNGGLARCQNIGYLRYSNVLKYGDSCSTQDVEQECDIDMECGISESENESGSEEECICKSGYISIPLSKKTICVEEASIDSNCNYTKQCTAIDTNAICKKNDLGVKVCQCNEDSYLYSEYKTDHIKTCRIKPTTTLSPTTEDMFDVVLQNNSSTEPNLDVEKSEDLIEENKSMNNKTKSKNKSDSTSNAGILFFFLAILLAILIVVIIIRVRNKSDKMTINKKRRTIEQQTDAKDGEQTQPILSENKEGVDEVDEDNKQTSNNGITAQHTGNNDKSQEDSNSNNNKETQNKVKNTNV